jgi:hypothetical protein
LQAFLPGNDGTAHHAQNRAVSSRCGGVKKKGRGNIKTFFRRGSTPENTDNKKTKKTKKHNLKSSKRL